MKDPTGTNKLLHALYKKINLILVGLKGEARQRLGAADLYSFAQLESIMDELTINEPLEHAAALAAATIAVTFPETTFSPVTNTGIFTRVFTSVKKHTAALMSDIVAIGSDWVTGRINKKEAGKRLTKSFKKTRNNLKLLFRTEVVRAYNLTVISKAESLAALYGVHARVRWQTREDNRVRSTHRKRNKRVYTLAEARRLLGEPGCRCGLRPFVVV